VPTVVTLVAEKHGDASRDLVADLAGLIRIPFSQFKILPEVDIGVMARSAIFDVLFDGLLVSTLQNQATVAQVLLNPQDQASNLRIQGIGGLPA
jgi:hypothetical protein